jgi:hypothetical protein
MRSAGYDMPGVQTYQDLVDTFGEEEAALYKELQTAMEAQMQRLGSLMEEHDCNIRQATMLALHTNDTIPDTPDDLSGFGWKD